jgi:hypothetical protein
VEILIFLEITMKFSLHVNPGSSQTLLAVRAKRQAAGLSSLSKSGIGHANTATSTWTLIIVEQLPILPSATMDETGSLPVCFGLQLCHEVACDPWQFYGLDNPARKANPSYQQTLDSVIVFGSANEVSSI